MKPYVLLVTSGHSDLQGLQLTIEKELRAAEANQLWQQAQDEGSHRDKISLLVQARDKLQQALELPGHDEQHSGLPDLLARVKKEEQEQKYRKAVSDADALNDAYISKFVSQYSTWHRGVNDTSGNRWGTIRCIKLW